MKAIITGADGQLARQLIATAPRGFELRYAVRNECDITDPGAVQALFRSFQPAVVVNTAAYTAVDAAEDASDLAYRVNATGTENVAMAARDVGARLIHISTDYVFDGKRSTPYPRDADTNPLNVYGASKLKGEALAMAVSQSTLIIRVGWLYSDSGKNFVTSILRALKAARPIRVVHNQVGCPTSALDLAHVIWKTATTNLCGIYHWANVGSANWYEFATEIARFSQQLGICRATPSITAVTSEEYGSRANRPAYSVLDGKDLWLAINEPVTTWQDALMATLERYARMPQSV